MFPPGSDESSAAPVAQAGAGAVVEAAAAGLPRFRLLWWLSLTIVAGDQLAKLAVRARLPLLDSVAIIPGLVDFTRVENQGVAFGLLNDAPIGAGLKTALTTTLAGLALAGIGVYARHVRPEERLARAGLSCILGGALGNLIDRLSRGYVTDFVDVYWRDWHFWAFNIADASITIGAILVFLDLLVVRRHAPHSV
jgi:signal peptidase II